MFFRVGGVNAIIARLVDAKLAARLFPALRAEVVRPTGNFPTTIQRFIITGLDQFSLFEMSLLEILKPLFLAACGVMMIR